MQGWFWPADARVAHYWKDSELVALCGYDEIYDAQKRLQWTHDGDHEHPSNCLKCRRIRRRMEAEHA